MIQLSFIYKNTPVCIGAIQLLPVGIDRPLMQRAFYFMEQEDWKPIKGYEGKYEVSNLGRVRSLDRFVRSGRGNGLKILSGRFISPVNTGGYLRVALRQMGSSSNFFVHRLVATAYIDNPKNKRCVNHKDCNRQNNLVENLEWVTHKENSQHASTKGRYKPATRHSIDMASLAKQKKVKATQIKTGLILDFASIKEFAAHVGLPKSYIYKSVNKGRLINNEWSYVIECKTR